MATQPKSEFELVEMIQKDRPDVRFMGKLIAEIDSRKVDNRRERRGSDRYTRLEVYELENNPAKLIACAVACSDRDGEVDIATVEEVPVEIRRDSVGRPFWKEDDGIVHRRILAAFGWTWLAKELAMKYGWDHVVELR